eukprot:448955-Rhodomonas_salina.2
MMMMMKKKKKKKKKKMMMIMMTLCLAALASNFKVPAGGARSLRRSLRREVFMRARVKVATEPQPQRCSHTRTRAALEEIPLDRDRGAAGGRTGILDRDAACAFCARTLCILVALRARARACPRPARATETRGRAGGEAIHLQRPAASSALAS